jgi:hypothetical protein
MLVLSGWKGVACAPPALQRPKFTNQPFSCFLFAFFACFAGTLLLFFWLSRAISPSATPELLQLLSPSSDDCCQQRFLIQHSRGMPLKTKARKEVDRRTARSIWFYSNLDLSL